MDQNMILYEEEYCKTCIDYHKKLRELNKLYNASLNKDTEIKRLITKNLKEYTEHNKCHIQINKFHIENINDSFQKYEVLLK